MTSGSIPEFDPRLKQPFRLICSGASSTGKTRLFDDLLKNFAECANPGLFDRLLVCYAVFQTKYSEWAGLAPHVGFVRGLPTEKDLELHLRKDERNVLVIDDLDDRENECEILHRIFTIHSHHLSCSVLYSQHNLFMKNRRSVLINRNANYLALMPNSRDKAGVRALGYQINPSDSLFLLKAFESAADGPGTFLLCDFDPETPAQFRFREGFRFPFHYYMSAKRTKNEDVDEKEKGHEGISDRGGQKRKKHS